MFGSLVKIAIGIITAVAVGSAIAVTLYVLNKKRIQEELRKRNLNMAIIENIKTGNVNIVKAGLYDDDSNKVEIVDFSAQKLTGIYEGMKIYA